MQARVMYERFPAALVAVFFAIAAALILGGVLGYQLKPPTIVVGPPQVIVDRFGPAGDASAEPPAKPTCVWSESGHKAC